MAVQAQYPSNAFAPDFCTRIQSNNLLDEPQMLLGRDTLVNSHPQLLLPTSLNHGGISPLIFSGGGSTNNNETVFSNPQSELTCIASVSKKRIRDEPSIMAQNQIGFAYANLIRKDLDQSRMLDSAGTSTSGRPSSSPIAQDLFVHLYRQSIEVDALVRLRNERLRLGLEQAQQRHCRALISALEQQVLKRLKEKESELENASRRNAELEEKVRQMSAENQIWFNVAKNNEAIVSSLRTSLEQVLLQNTVNAVQAKEGCGDSDGRAFPAEDAQSCCFEGGEERTDGEVKATAVERRRKCKACGDKDVSVLVLPCRHLCFCKDCESKSDTCPICHATKNACLQIFMS